MANDGVYTYRPSLWVLVAVCVTLLIFITILIIAIYTDIKVAYVALAAFMTFCTVLALIEAIIARVHVELRQVVIKGLVRTERVALADVEKVSAEGGRVALFMKTGRWKKLPEWLGANMSARRRIADRLER